MAVEKVNTQMQLVTEYINIFGITIQLKGEENIQNKYKQTRY
jgi:ferritin